VDLVRLRRYSNEPEQSNRVDKCLMDLAFGMLHSFIESRFCSECSRPERQRHRAKDVRILSCNFEIFIVQIGSESGFLHRTIYIYKHGYVNRSPLFESVRGR